MKGDTMAKPINGEVLRTLRLRKGLTIAELARRAVFLKEGAERHVSEQTIIGIEGGRHKDVIDSTLVGLAKALEMDVMELEKALAGEVVSPPAQA